MKGKIISYKALWVVNGTLNEVELGGGCGVEGMGKAACLSIAT